jgi:hypothetical protein
LELTPSSYVGSGNVWDASVGASDATLTGTPTYNSLSGFTFNGTNYGRIPSVDGVTNFTNTDEYTVEIWFNPANYQGSSTLATIFEKWNQSNQSRYPYAFRYGESASTVSMAIYDGTNNQTLTSTGFTTNNWYQVVGVFNFTTDVMTIYKNGTPGSSISLSGVGAVGNTSSAGIAHRISTMGGAQFYMKGTVGTIRIYNTALTSEEISTNYNADKSKYGLT